MRIYISIALLFIINTISAQTDYPGRNEQPKNKMGLENFDSPPKDKIVRLEKSDDTVAVGKSVSVSIIIENASLKKAINPAFEGFVLDGPAISTSMSMINGVTSQSITYTYNLRAKNVGEFFLSSLKIETDKGVFYTEPSKIVVLDEYFSSKPKRQQNRSLFNDDFFGFSRSPFPPTKPKPQPRSSQPAQKKKNYNTEDL